MLDVISPAAQVAANASRAIASITDELGTLQASSEEMRAEMRSLLGERSESDSRARALSATVAAARADLQKQALAEEMAAGTALVERAREATAAASALWDAAHQDETGYLEAWTKRSHIIEERLSFLQKSLDEQAAMSASLQARRGELQEIYDSAHRDHGKDEQAVLEDEFAAIGKSRKAIIHMLSEVDKQEAALRDQIPERLHSWPGLARESVRSHLDYKAGPMVRVLSAWRTIAETTGEDIKQIDQQLVAAYIGETSTLPLWHLNTYGPRSRYQGRPEHTFDLPLRNFERMLRNLESTLADLESKEREKQTSDRLT